MKVMGNMYMSSGSRPLDSREFERVGLWPSLAFFFLFVLTNYASNGARS